MIHIKTVLVAHRRGFAKLDDMMYRTLFESGLRSERAQFFFAVAEAERRIVFDEQFVDPVGWKASVRRDMMDEKNAAGPEYGVKTGERRLR